MILASAYPNSALSAGPLMAIVFVAAGVLALWLGLVFLADRPPRRKQDHRAPVAPPESATEDRDSEHPEHHGIAA